MIEFSETAQSASSIEYYNQKGEVVRTYKVEEFENYVMANNIIPVPKEEFQPMTIHSEWFGKYNEWCLEKFIDDNFIKLTTDFYNSVNASEFKSGNTETQTRKTLLS